MQKQAGRAPPESWLSKVWQEGAALLWMWGLAGAFLFGGPKLVRCWAICREKNCRCSDCFLEFLVVLGVGAISGAAFTTTLLTWVPIKEDKAISTIIGVFANPIVPELTKRVARLADRILKVFDGDEK